MAGLVLDSSIALSWCLPDEAAPEVDEVQRTVATHGAVVPVHWPLKVANALLMAVRRARIDASLRDAALRDLAALPIALDPETSSRAWHDTLRLADAHRLTACDAAYLELAHRRDLPLATLDAELRVAARAFGVALLAAQGDHIDRRAAALGKRDLGKPDRAADAARVGGGKRGRMGAPPAIAAAIEDALKPLGVKIDALPVTPARLRALIREAEARQPAAAEQAGRASHASPGAGGR